MFVLHIINVFGSILLMPVVILAILPWPFRDIGVAVKQKSGKDNWLLKVYRGLMKIHIPLGIYTLVMGLFHAIFASMNHGFGMNWGTVTMILFIIGFIVFLLRKKLGRIWVPLHRIFEYAATVCMFIHCAPHLKTAFTVIVPMFLRQIFGG